LVINSNI